MFIRPFAPNGMAARIALAIIESAGIMYANVGPVIVSGLARTGLFDAETAGYVLAVNLAGTAVGGLLVIPFLTRFDWKRAILVLLLALMAFDLGSAGCSQSGMLLAMRFGHGLCGGALIGYSLSVIARMHSPERTISLFIVIQLLFGGALAAITTPLLDSIGLRVIWFTLVGFSAAGLLLLPFLDAYPVREIGSARGVTASRAGLAHIVFVMLAILCFQVGEMGAFAYVVQMGLEHRLEADFVGNTLAVSLWLGGPATLFVTWWGIRSGRLRPMAISTLVCGCAIMAIAIASPAAFLAANVLFTMAFGIALSYMLGVGSELDNTGRMGAVAGFFSAGGLAVGPALAGYLVGFGWLKSVFVLGGLGVIASLALIWLPARALDRKSPTARIRWE